MLVQKLNSGSRPEQSITLMQADCAQGLSRRQLVAVPGAGLHAVHCICKACRQLAAVAGRAALSQGGTHTPATHAATMAVDMQRAASSAGERCIGRHSCCSIKHCPAAKHVTLTCTPSTAAAALTVMVPGAAGNAWSFSATCRQGESQGVANISWRQGVRRANSL